MKVVALDPGGTTGIAVLDTESYEVTLSELGPYEHHLALDLFLVNEKPDVIICEEFTYRVVQSKGTKMPGISLISKEYIGITKLYVEMVNIEGDCCKLIMQTPAQGGGGRNHSGFWKNDKLKQIGLYTAPEGRQHMADALRHALFWLSFTRKDDHFIRMLK